MYVVTGGIPEIIKGSAAVGAWSAHLLRKGVANGLVLVNTGGNPLRVAFSVPDRDADVYWTVAGGATMGPWPAEFGGLHVQSTGGVTTFEVIAFVRRG